MQRVAFLVVFVLGVSGSSESRGELVLRQVLRQVDNPEFSSVSRDGTLLSYVDDSTFNLHVRDLRSGNVSALTADGRDAGPHAMWSVFSPDAQTVAYYWTDPHGDEIRTVSISGDRQRVLARVDQGRWTELCDWSRDSQNILAARTSTGSNTDILLISTRDGAERILKAQPTPVGRMTFSPNGKWVAHDGPQMVVGRASDVYLLSIADGTDYPIVRSKAHDTVAGWSEDGQILYFVSNRTGSNGLWAVRVDGPRVVGDPMLIKPDLGNVKSMIGFTSEGVFYYSVDVSMIDVYEADIDLSLNTAAVRGPVTERFTGANRYPSWSPDGTSFLYLSNPSIGGRYIFIDAPESRQYTPPLAWFNRPEWTRRGVIAITGGDYNGQEGIYGIDPATSMVRLLIGRDNNETPFHGEWSRDGSKFYNRHQDAHKGIYRLEMDSMRKTTIYTPPTGWQVAGCKLSPDESLLAFEMSDGPLRNLTVLDTTTLKARRVMALEPGVYLPCCRPVTWSPDSRSLVVMTVSGDLRSAWVVRTDGGQPAQLPLKMRGMANPDLNRDGRRLLFEAGENRFEAWALKGFAGAH